MDQEPGQPESDTAYCAALARAEDRDRFLAAQFASPPARARLLALLALNAEIARVPRAAREPLLAEMRLQWWYEAVVAVLAGKPPPRQPALAAFARAAAGAGLVAEPFERLIVAHARDLTANPLRDAADAESHAEALSGTLAHAALALLGVTDEAACRAARAAGIAHALVGLAGGGNNPARDLIRDHIARARAESAHVPRSALPVLLWATAADIRSGRMARGHTL
ncbi:MAG: squalene/phytoene synthase family protein, partial [Pseudomonadota bacterium]